MKERVCLRFYEEAENFGTWQLFSSHNIFPGLEFKEIAQPQLKGKFLKETVGVF
jgi:hypothetical protein|tara:strand:- start:6502 stop:6663 length:162 start_codon:yes stop_codon:yes gene_type:complete